MTGVPLAPNSMRSEVSPLALTGYDLFEVFPNSNVGGKQPQEANEELTITSYVQRFNQVPHFWRFLRGLRTDDPIAELIRNGLDVKASHTMISIELDRLICQGDGQPVQENGGE